MQHLVQALQPHGDHRQPQARRQHADARLKPRNLTMLRPFSLWKNQDGPPVSGKLSGISKRVTRASLPLRQGKRIEEERCLVVVKAAGEPGKPRVLFREKVRAEK